MKRIPLIHALAVALAIAMPTAAFAADAVAPKAATPEAKPVDTQAARAELAEMRAQMQELSRKMAALSGQLGDAGPRAYAMRYLGDPDRGMIGVVVSRSGESGKELRISAVTPGSPAARAGVHVGDVITGLLTHGAFNVKQDAGNKADSTNSILRNLKVDQDLTVEVRRDGKTLKFPLKAERREPYVIADAIGDMSIDSPQMRVEIERAQREAERAMHDAQRANADQVRANAEQVRANAEDMRRNALEMRRDAERMRVDRVLYVRKPTPGFERDAVALHGHLLAQTVDLDFSLCGLGAGRRPHQKGHTDRDAQFSVVSLEPLGEIILIRALGEQGVLRHQVDLRQTHGPLRFRLQILALHLGLQAFQIETRLQCRFHGRVRRSRLILFEFGRNSVIVGHRVNVIVRGKAEHHGERSLRIRLVGGQRFQVLAGRPDAVKVEESDRRGQLIVELSMAPGELGRIIGRQGRTAAAVRTLAAAAGELEGKRVVVDFRDD